MKRMLPFFLIVFSSAAFSDEYYEFYKISCATQINSIEVTRLGFWNIGDVIWPELDWDQHVKSLQLIENKDHLYVFNELYGYYDKQVLDFDCGNFQAKITFDKLTREPGPVGGGKPVRMNAKITIRSYDKLLASAIPLEQILRIGAYQSESVQYVVACTELGCRDDLYAYDGTVTTKTLRGIKKLKADNQRQPTR